MTDRELLELAAKAAGYAVEWHEVVVSRRGRFGLIEHTKKEGFRLNFQRWDPLTDDGDALRLAVKLRMQVSITTESCRAETLPVLVVGVNGKDELAATRRAIVMAAANALADKL